MSVRSVENDYGLVEGALGSGIFLETRVLSLLYLLILVPKEFWSLDINNDVYNRIYNAWSLNDVVIKIDNSKWNNPTYKFIHHLRNAIAHVNFKLENSNFEFWDQWNSNPEQYRAEFSITCMQRFLEVVGSMFANLRNEASHNKTNYIF